jgi:hypothetical protein
MMQRWRHVLVVLGLWCGLVGKAQAHSTSNAYLWLDASIPSQAPTLRIDVPLTDVDRAVWLDRDHNGDITWAELQDRWAEIQTLVRQGLTWHQHEPCTMGEASPARLAQHSDGTHASLTYSIHCKAGGAALPTAVAYRLFAPTNADHRGLLRIVGLDQAQPVVVLSPLGKGLTPLPVVPSAVPDTSNTTAGLQKSAWPTFADFFMQGLAHIAAGADHVVFLVLLILGCVLRRPSQQPGALSSAVKTHGFAGWTVSPSRVRAVKQALVLVTAFTLAHSLSLAMMATGWVQPPSAWVEIVIALSVLVTAVDNVRPLTKLPRWLFTWVFGLAHGFGFGAPLQDLGLKGSELLLPLLGFNLGVEAGQLVIVLWVLPLVIALASRPWYVQRVVVSTSVLAAMAATYWVVERVQPLA